MRASVKIVVGCVALALAGFIAIGRDQIWVMLAGPADLGPVDLATVKPPWSPNHYLVCPAGLCAKAHADMVSPTFPVSAGQLKIIAQQAWVSEPRVKLVDSDRQTHRLRYVQRTAIMHFPDTISVRFIDLGPGKATLAIYSRSQIGYSDVGANKARVLRWLALLQARASWN